MKDKSLSVHCPNRLRKTVESNTAAKAPRTVLSFSNKYRHGGPYERGAADRYYDRPFCPHYYKGKTYLSERVDRNAMTETEIAQYTEGFNDMHDRKDWG